MSVESIRIRSGVDNECSCLLIQVDPIKLLVPRVLIAEVVPFNISIIKPTAQEEIDALQWQGREVPMIKPLLINPLCLGEVLEDSKVLIFHGLLDQGRLPYFALLSSKNPRVLQVSDESVIVDANIDKINLGELQAVQVNGDSAVIPKVDFLERFILDNHKFR